MPDQRSTDAAFTERWDAVKPEVIRFCRWSAGRLGEAEELYQRVLIRSWRGWPTFRGDGSFLSWVLRIAQREAARLGAERSRIARAEAPLDSLTREPAVPEEPRVDAGWVRAAVARATAAGALNPAESAVVLGRLDHPDDSWQTLAERLGSSANVCAVTHFRAVPKLRVFILENDPDLVAAPETLAAAFRRALTAQPEPLTAAEAEAFRTVVLERRVEYRRAGARTALRAACAKVVKQLEFSPANR